MDTKPEFGKEGEVKGEVVAEKKRSSFFSFLKELLFLILTAFVIAWIIKSFVVQPFKIEQQSMLPTLYPQDRVFVNKFIYRLREPQKGDIVTFRSPTQPRILIKRIIATEKETVLIKEGQVFINGEVLIENYISSLPDYSYYGPLKIPPEHVFVLGDNRPNSGDSRLFGPLPEENLLGEAFFVYWPLKHVKVIP